MENNIKITSPKEMDLSDISDIIKQFEEQLKKQGKGEDYYHLVISGEYKRKIYNQIEKLYLNAGWRKVVCQSSSENGERPGLSGLQLYR